MTQRTWPLVLVFVLGCVSCTETTPPPSSSACADEYFEGTVTFPDGTSDTACSPARAEGFGISFSPSPVCTIVAGGGGGDSAAASWNVAGHGDWFTRVGRADLELFYSPNGATSTRCPVGLPPSMCDYHQPACQFEVTRAAGSDGDILEGRLVSPCTMPDPSDPVAGGWTPVVTSMRFRVHVAARMDSDAGVACSYP